MSHDESKHPRNPDAANTGEFGPKTVSAPPAGLLDAPKDVTEHYENGFRKKVTSFHPNGVTALISVHDNNGFRTRLDKFAETADEYGDPVIESQEFFAGENRNDPSYTIPSVRTWRNGVIALEMRHKMGNLNDAVGGEPAVLAFDENGKEQMRIHYHNGEIQDPKPGVPAHVATLGNGMSRSTFYTRGRVTEQQDRFPMPDMATFGVGDALIVTRKAR
jgi:hypothetical protein